jgi:acrylyl-CoA reductase (NADPH)
MKERWAGGVDAVGSHVLANLLASTKQRGTVTACGLAAGMDLPVTVAPFILRGVTLAGIDSVYAAPSRRRLAWHRLASDLPVATLRGLSRTIGLEEAEAASAELLAGKVKGRLVVAIGA